MSSMFSGCGYISRKLLQITCHQPQVNLSWISAFKRETHLLSTNFSHLRHTSNSRSKFHSAFFLSSSLKYPPSFLSSTFFSLQSGDFLTSMNLKAVLEVLEQLVPLSLAESWDNVGLLVEPGKLRPIKSILLTNDLTADVMDEAEAMKCDLIISYHPPLFRPIKRLVQTDWKQQLAIRAIESGIAIFSPHTSWDSSKAGLNDWLIGGVGSGQVSVLHQATPCTPQRHRLEFIAQSQEEFNDILLKLKKTEASEQFQYTMHRGVEEGKQVILTCPSSVLTDVVQVVLENTTASQSLNITKIQKPPMVGYGQGRCAVLDEPISVAVAVQRLKAHLNLPHLRLALGYQKTLDSVLKSVAVCAGSGSSVLQGVKADLYVTGEMSHHEVLDAATKGTCIILSEHSNSERGFLTVFKERLSSHLPESVTVTISKKDRDPLQVV